MLLNCGVGEDSWRVLWTAGRSNQSILKEIRPEHSLEGLMLKLKLQHFGHLMRRTNSLAKTLMLGKIEGRKRRGQQKMRMDGITDLLDMSMSKLWKRVKNVDGSLACCSPWCCRVGHDWVTGQQHRTYLGIIFIPSAGSKGIKGYKVVWLKDLLVGFYSLHALKFQIMRGDYLGRQCTQTIKETAVASSHKIEM